jgi:pyruvate/2-oxoglutarate dehydrogenase complex dihydrolipoamide acyltransferase (E2) component
VEPGQFVKAGQALFEVETDKATVAVEAFRDGYLVKILVTPGTEVSLEVKLLYWQIPLMKSQTR